MLDDKAKTKCIRKKACQRVKGHLKNTGTSKVHHISWNAGEKNNQIIHRHFTNLASINQGYKVFLGEDMMPTIEEGMSAGHVIKKSLLRESTGPGRHKGSTIFLPCKSPDDQVSPFYQAPSKGDYQPPSSNLFAGRLYQIAGWIHKFGALSEGIALDEEVSTDEIEKEGTKDMRDAEEIQDLLQEAKELAEERLTRDACCSEFPPSSLFDKHWAVKANRNHVRLDEEVMKMFQEKFDQGKGYKNKDKKMTPEMMVVELRASKHVKRRMDQQMMIQFLTSPARLTLSLKGRRRLPTRPR